ncbi:hypothetical protein [Ferruginivarius sediminum]|uniref:Secreted protein n=1 Tax=Ferruginivarius sediminum TaxID=2661937 RepID=A0A369T612_9PROT|nr:hypothetical protein [Ferruginivarius sediminum]RDD60761.1 hypothetical protein DRB17_16310 [Ferruginivarius sediminum]
MRSTVLSVSLSLATAFMLHAVPARADQTWIKPHIEACTLERGDTCGADVKCPDNAPYAVNGGGGMPMADPADHRVAMTMNLPVSANHWRVRWRNLGGKETKVKVAIRVLCSDDGSAWGE